MRISNSRIWELDALRGFCILCMFVVHLLFDLVFFAGMRLSMPAWYTAVQQYGGTLFVVLSGLCATLGHRSVRRGAVVFSAGLLISLVTASMYWLKLSGADVIVWFGVLHLLGICMMLYPLLKKQPTLALLFEAVCIIVLGYLFVGVRVQCRWLFPLGLIDPAFYSSDFYPLFPQLGFFMLGICIGRTLYREKKSLLPCRFQNSFAAKALCRIGQNSLVIYLAHQPILYGVIELFLLLGK